MMRSDMCTVLCLVVAVQGSLANQLSDDQIAQFPRLFHLDDYDRCLASPGGFYCLGSFSLGPTRSKNRLYQALEEHSKDMLHFNRTQLHRGYCVSSRCPLPGQLPVPKPHNLTERFAACVAQWASTHGLDATPLAVQYCRTSEEARNAIIQLDAPKIAFLVVIFCILFFNVVGTVYDVLTPKDEKKNKFLVSWSCVENFRRLVYLGGYRKDPRRAALLPAHAVRVITLMLVILMHCGFIHYTLYSYNSHYLEKMMRDTIFMTSRNGTAIVCLFLLLSSFLLATNMLQLQRSRTLSFRLLPSCILHRVARISPLYLLVVGFSATWWAELGGGPQWAGGVVSEAARCRRKFWSHALFLNNLVQPYDHCLIQTWYLAVDTQLYVVCCALCIWLSRDGAGAGRRSILLLSALFTAACVLNGVLAYAFDWKSMLYITSPETLRHMYRGVSSFAHLYMAPWGTLPAALLGLLLAHAHAHLTATGFKFNDHKLLMLAYRCSISLMTASVASGLWLQRLEAPAPAVHAALDRPLFSIFGALMLLGLFQGAHGFAKRLFSWLGWVVLSRMSLAALLLHWGVALGALSASPQPLPAGYCIILWEWLATTTVTYLLAVPLTVLVEMPAQRTVDAILS